MNYRHAIAFLALLTAPLGCTRTTPGVTVTDARMQSDARGGTRVSQPLFEGMGDYRRPVRVSGTTVREYFDQGLTWAYAFNHDEAIRSFEAAASLDPQCAMAWWGVALCHGPHINNPFVPEERARAAWDALQKALQLKENESPVNQALIDALTARYADPQPADRRPLDAAYAAAMAAVYARFPDDPDVGTLYAESLMNLRPWDLWTHDGRPQPETPEICRVLERVLDSTPNHPGAPHLYIHAMEASPTPEKAIPAADRLRHLVSGSGHLVHMPSHIDVLTGRWDLAVEQNEMAIAASAAYRALSPRQGFYRLYMLHNHHMLAFAAMMDGRRELALRAAREVISSVPDDYAREQAALVDPYMAIVTEVLMRFGRWEEILKEPAPPEHWPIATAMWRFARGVSYAVLGEHGQALRERDAFRAAVKRVPPDALMAINRAHDALAIASRVLDGEIAYQNGDFDAGVALLREAARLEDDLLYMEPPEWIQPARHALGAVLLAGGKAAEAEQVYREDLSKWPENGWSLYGLSQSLAAQGRHDEAGAAQRRFAKAWERADTKIHASCLCVKAAGK